MALQHSLKRAGEKYPKAYTKVTNLFWASNKPEDVRIEVTTWANEADRRANKPPLEVKPFVMHIDTKVEDWAFRLAITLGYREMTQHSHYEKARDV